MTVAKNGKYFSIYVGNLIKRGDVCFNPVEPPLVLTDPVPKEDMSNMIIFENEKPEEKPKEEPKDEGDNQAD